MSVLKQLHDDLDSAVFDVYGWPATLDDGAILERLVALNAERAKEESKGTIRWLRPEFQYRTGTAMQTELGVAGADGREDAETKGKDRSTEELSWPKSMPEQVRVLHDCLVDTARPVSASDLARRCIRTPAHRVEDVLQALVAVGKARSVGEGRYMTG